MLHLTDKCILEPMKPYLRIIDMIVLRKVCKKLSLDIIHYFEIIASKKLETCAISYFEMKHLLIRTESYFSGSFVLQCMLSSMNNIIIYEKSDLDIYVHLKQECVCAICKSTVTPLSSLGEELCCKHLINKEGYISNIKDDFSDEESSNKPHKKQKLEHNIALAKTTKTSLQIQYSYEQVIATRNWMVQTSQDGIKREVANVNEIIMRQDSCILEFINECFDFDFCKSSFDGKTLRIYSIDSLMYKKTKCTIGPYCDDPQTCQCYMGRDEFVCRRRRIIVQERIPKYRKRGFAIDVIQQ